MPPSDIPVKRQRRPDTVPQAGSLLTIPRGREGVESLLDPVLKGSPLSLLACGPDLLLVDGDPLQDLSLLGDPEKNLLVVMKDGQLYKQTSAVTAARA
jgi:hypothetical protein